MTIWAMMMPRGRTSRSRTPRALSDARGSSETRGPDRESRTSGLAGAPARRRTSGSRPALRTTQPDVPRNGRHWLRELDGDSSARRKNGARRCPAPGDSISTRQRRGGGSFGSVRVPPGRVSVRPSFSRRVLGTRPSSLGASVRDAPRLRRVGTRPSSSGRVLGAPQGPHARFAFGLVAQQIGRRATANCAIYRSSNTFATA